MDPDRWERKRARFERKRRHWERKWEGNWENRDRARSPAQHLFWGLALVTVGMVFLFGNMGMVDARYLLGRYWPLLLIAVGVLRLIEPGADERRSNSGIFWIVVGAFFLAGSTGVLQIAFWNFWPIALIGWGALMLWRSSCHNIARRQARKDPYTMPFDSNDPDMPSMDPAAGSATAADGGKAETGASPGPTSNSFVSAMAVLGSVERRNNSQDFRGGSATAVMGGCEIDLRAAGIAPGREPVLEVFAMWGGIEIIVPPDWTVVSHVDPILGGFEDSTLPPKEEKKRFIVRGTVVMGGIEVTN
jgi:predicted membrane protein